MAALPVVFVDQWGDEEEPSKNKYGETYRLRHLLALVTTRGDYGRQLIQVRRKKVDQLDRETLRDARLVVVAGIKDPEIIVPLLRAYVQLGGQLVIAAGAEFDPKAWNSSAWLDGQGILPSPLKPDLVGRLPDESECQLSFFQLDFSSMREVDYFKIDKVSPQELQDLYHLPVFFKAAAVDLNDETVKSMIAAETKQIEETRKFLTGLTEKTRLWADAEARGTLSAADRDERQLSEQRRAEVAPHWLLWPQSTSSDLVRVPTAELAQRTTPRVKASFTNGLPFLVERNIGQGKVLFFSTGVQSEWNNLTVTNTVLMFDRIFRELLEQTLPETNEDPVEQIRVPVEPTDRLNRFTLTRPGGAIEDLAVDALGGDQYGVTLRSLGQRGIYRVTAHRAESAAQEGQDTRLWEKPLAVNGPIEESELQTLDEAALKNRLGQANYRWISSTDAISLEGAVVRGQFIWRWFIILMLIMLLVELSILAWPTLKARRAATAEARHDSGFGKTHRPPLWIGRCRVVVGQSLGPGASRLGRVGLPGDGLAGDCVLPAISNSRSTTRTRCPGGVSRSAALPGRVDPGRADPGHEIHQPQASAALGVVRRHRQHGHPGRSL